MAHPIRFTDEGAIGGTGQKVAGASSGFTARRMLI